MADVFISYKREERELLRPLFDGLATLFVTVWIDARLTPGRSFTEEIRQELDECRALIVCWSQAAVGSEWVRGEAEVGRQRQNLVAVQVEECRMLPPFNMIHAENLIGWNGESSSAAWQNVLTRLGALLERPGLPELANLLSTGTAAEWRTWSNRYRDDPAFPLAIARASAKETGGTNSSVDVANPTVDELERAREAAEFRLRVYRDAARRFGWKDSSEEQRLEQEVEKLRADTLAKRPTSASAPQALTQLAALRQIWRSLKSVTTKRLVLGVGAAALAALFGFVVPGMFKAISDPENSIFSNDYEDRIADLESKTASMRALTENPDISIAQPPPSQIGLAPGNSELRQSSAVLPTGDVDRNEVERRVLSLLGGRRPAPVESVDEDGATAVEWCADRLSQLSTRDKDRARETVLLAFANAASEQGLQVVSLLEALSAEGNVQSYVARCATELYYALPDE